MTAQIPETLLRDGEELTMCTEPLGHYFRFSGKSPGFTVNCTALWRGYIGTWELREGRLYLIGINARYEDGKEATLDNLFPGYPDRVFAHWFSGVVRCPRGRQLEYVHGGYASTFEQDLLLRFERGVLVEENIRTNGEAEPDAPEGYGPGAFTIFPDQRDENEEARP